MEPDKASPGVMFSRQIRAIVPLHIQRRGAEVRKRRDDTDWSHEDRQSGCVVSVWEYARYSFI